MWGLAGGSGRQGSRLSIPQPPLQRGARVSAFLSALTYSWTATQRNFLTPGPWGCLRGEGSLRRTSPTPARTTQMKKLSKVPTLLSPAGQRLFGGSGPTGMTMGVWGAGDPPTPRPAPFTLRQQHLVPMATRLMNASIWNNQNLLGPHWNCPDVFILKKTTSGILFY